MHAVLTPTWPHKNEHIDWNSTLPRHVRILTACAGKHTVWEYLSCFGPLFCLIQFSSVTQFVPESLRAPWTAAPDFHIHYQLLNLASRLHVH